MAEPLRITVDKKKLKDIISSWRKEKE